ncbi:MAG: N-acetyltransferase [Pseudomonas sp.]|nr:MAG: N-acetyltransferase [Pseudomonas sp.]
MSLIISASDEIEKDEVVHLYKENVWSSAEKPAQLLAALRNSHSLVTARLDGQLVGLANAISDGHLVVYFPHMLVMPKMQRQGIGRKIMETMIQKYSGFHQLMLTADGAAVDFYKDLGFSRAGQTEPLWIYHGNDH